LRKLYASKNYLGRKSQIAKNVCSPSQIANPQIATFAEGPQIYQKLSPQICGTYLRNAHLVARIGIFTDEIFASHILNFFFSVLQYMWTAKQFENELKIQCKQCCDKHILYTYIFVGMHSIHFFRWGGGAGENLFYPELGFRRPLEDPLGTLDPPPSLSHSPFCRLPPPLPL
jgi:hypothetical protein